MRERYRKITEQDFAAYQAVQSSGVTNMFDVVIVEALSGLDRDKILDIMKHYSRYDKEWNSD